MKGKHYSVKLVMCGVPKSVTDSAETHALLPVSPHTTSPTDLDKETDGNEDGEYEHSSEAVEVQGPPPSPVHEGDGHQRHHHHDGAHAQCGILRLPLLQARRGEERGGVVEDLQQGGRG